MTQKYPKLTIAVTFALTCSWASFYALQTHAERPESGRSTRPTAELLLAQNRPDATPASEPDGSETKIRNNPRLAKATLRKARENLRQRDSIQADITETVVIGNRKFTAHGSYLQGTAMRLRLEYHIQVGGEEGSLLEVSDGQVLWTRHTIGADQTKQPEEDEATQAGSPADETGEAGQQTEAADEPQSKSHDNVRITRRDIAKIRKAAAENQNVPERVLTVELGLGGLPALLASLEESIQFNTVQEERIDSQVFTVVEGGWTLESLQKFNSQDPNARLPDHVPERVRLYFDGDTLFPRRIQYLKRDAVRSFFRPMLTLDFVNVLLDGPIDEMAFQFVPPEGVLANDITELYLRQLAAGAKRFETPSDGQPPAEDVDLSPGAEDPPAAEPDSPQ